MGISSNGFVYDFFFFPCLEDLQTPTAESKTVTNAMRCDD